MKKLTICIFHPEYLENRIGGAEVQCYLIGVELAELGWNVIYVSDAFNGEKKHRGMRLVPFDSAQDEHACIEKLVGIFEEYNVDLCYQRGRKLYTWLGYRACHIRSIPFINALAMDIDLHRFKFVMKNRNSVRGWLRNLYHIRKLWKLDVLTLEAIKKADCVLFQSDSQKRTAKSRYNIDGKLVRNMHGMPEEEKNNSSGGKVVVLWLATLKSWKQPEVFMKLAQELKHKNCLFVIAGNISDHRYIDLVKSYTENLPNLEYVPCSTLEESNRLISSATIFVNTSISNEGFPNTFIQSWLRETVVVSLSFNPDGLLSRGNLGYCSGSYDELTHDVSQLIDDVGRRKEIANHAKEYAGRMHSIEENIEDVSSLFRGLIIPKS